ncbi:8539_t:CDS:2, partial [Diversispora eburnea]
LLTYVTDWMELQSYIEQLFCVLERGLMYVLKKKTYDKFEGENIVCLAITNSQSQNIQQVSSESHSGIGSLPSQFTWYMCSKFSTNYTVTTPNFGTVVDGHHTQSYNQLGLLTYLTDWTGLQLYIDPTSNGSVYYDKGSCFDSPQIRCTKKMTYDEFKGESIVCLAITNPQNQEVKFSLSISFTLGESLPAVTPIGTLTTTASKPTTSSTTSSKIASLVAYLESLNAYSFQISPKNIVSSNILS